MISTKLSESVVSQQNSIVQKACNTNLIINYLPQSITNNELALLFSQTGEIASCKIIRDRITGNSLGYGFVNYYRPEDAEKAISEMNGMKLQNKTIKVAYARGSSDTIKDTNLYIAGLPENVNQQKLEDLFSPFGHIISSNVLSDKLQTRSNGVGFVRFNEYSEAERAVQALNGTTLEGCTEPITVKFANKSNNIASSSNTSRFTGPIRHAVSQYRYSPMAKDSVNRRSPGNTTDYSGWCLFVYNLEPELEENALWQLFGPMGAVHNVKIMRDPQTNKSKGFAFVTMVNYNEACMAVQSLNGITFGNRVLQVSFKTNKRTINM